MKAERKDALRRRPNKVRYFYLAVSKTTLHTGMSHGGLSYAHNKHEVVALYIADLVKQTVTEVKEPVDKFLNRWRLNYNVPEWDYAKEIEKGIPAPDLGVRTMTF